MNDCPPFFFICGWVRVTPQAAAPSGLCDVFGSGHADCVCVGLPLRNEIHVPRPTPELRPAYVFHLRPESEPIPVLIHPLRHFIVEAYRLKAEVT